MTKVKKIKEFTNQFSKMLSLTDEQISKINDIELEIYREDFWDHTYPRPNRKFRFLRKISQVITRDQYAKLKWYRDDMKKEKGNAEMDKIKKVTNSEKKRLKDLSLTDKQLVDFAKFRIKVPGFIREHRSNNIGHDVNIDEIRRDLEEEYLAKFLSKKQLAQYQTISKAEHIKKLKWLIKLSSAKFEYIYKIKLRDDQRESIHRIEEFNLFKDADGEYYSEYEQEKIKLAKLRQVLDVDQISIYETYYAQHIKNIENNHKESDLKRVIHVDRLNKELDYLIKNILPKTSIARAEIEESLSKRQKEKVKIIKNQYLKVVKDTFEKSKIQFEKYTKNIAVNEMKESEIRMKIDLINPKIYHLLDFKPAEELMSNDLILVSLLNRKTEQLQPAYEKLVLLMKKNYEETVGQYGENIMVIRPTEKQIKLSTLNLLLLEPELEKNLERIDAIYK